MQINQFNNEVRLLDIANNRKPEIAKPTTLKKSGFKETFSQELNKTVDLNFSKHASRRLYSRGIEMSNDRLARLSDAVHKAADKGAKETLILDDTVAYLVSVDNRTVISAFSRDNLREGVFTSIDSAVIL